jgi:hypothetical protein
MSDCYFIASGVNFDVEAFLTESTLHSIAKVFRRGQSTSSNLRPVRNHSGFRVEILSPEDDQLEPQVGAATKFLRENRADLTKLANFAGVDELELGFGLFWLEDTACYPLSLPANFLLLAGECGVSVTLYVFAASADDK